MERFKSRVCDVCHQIRPDADIGVLSVDTSIKYKLPFGTMQRNIKYCKDKCDPMEVVRNEGLEF